MRIFLTGADGLLGNNLVRLLLDSGYEVKVFIQTGKDPGYLKDLPITFSYGDLLDKQSLSEAAAGYDVFINAAAVTNTWPSQGQLYWDVNVKGVEHVIDVVKQHQFKRLIHVGTANSFGPGDASAPGDETRAFEGAKYGLDYITSKYAAQQLVLEEAKKGLPAVIVNPTFMIGPYDVKPSSGKMIISLLQEKVPGYTQGGRNFVYVKDVAQAVANAITKGEHGEAYIAAGHNLTYKEMFHTVADKYGVKRAGLSLPKFAVLLYGAVLGLVGKITGKEPMLSTPLARISNEFHYYLNAKAQRVLGMPMTPLEDAVDEAVEWFKANNYL